MNVIYSLYNESGPCLKCKQDARRRLNYTHSQSCSRFLRRFICLGKKARLQLSQPPGSGKCTVLRVSGAAEGTVQRGGCSVWDKRSLLLVQNSGTNRTLCPTRLSSKLIQTAKCRYCCPGSVRMNLFKGPARV